MPSATRRRATSLLSVLSAVTQRQRGSGRLGAPSKASPAGTDRRWRSSRSAAGRSGYTSEREADALGHTDPRTKGGEKGKSGGLVPHVGEEHPRVKVHPPMPSRLETQLDGRPDEAL